MADSKADPGVESRRKVPMQVLSLGMSRTGTTSMQAALDILGCGPTYHASELFSHLPQCELWSRALEAKYHPSPSRPPFKKADWDELLGNYGSITDTPAVCFSDELVALYPDAKVVVVEREIEAWYASFSNGVIDTFTMPINKYLVALDPQMMGPFYRMWEFIFLDPRGLFRSGNKRELEENARDVYREHYAHVRKISPKDRLLEYRLGSGWEPLCEFLGKPVPVDVPFPRLNEGDEVKKKSWTFQVKSLGNALRNVIMLGGTIGVGVYAVVWGLGLNRP